MASFLSIYYPRTFGEKSKEEREKEREEERKRKKGRISAAPKLDLAIPVPGE